jgi:hypothetical protein
MSMRDAARPCLCTLPLAFRTLHPGNGPLRLNANPFGIR